MNTLFALLFWCCAYYLSAQAYSDYYSTLPLRESPFPEWKGVVRLSKERALTRNHYRFDYDTSGQLISLSFRLGETLRSPNHTSNYFFTTSEIRFVYTDTTEIRTFYNEWGDQVTQRGVWQEVYCYSPNSSYDSLYFLDDKGNRATSTWGIYLYKWEEEVDGSVVEQRLDKEGKSMDLRPGFDFDRIRLHYRADGMLALMQNIDSNGLLLDNNTGVAQDDLHYDRYGRWIGWTVMDEHGQVKSGNGPRVAKGINVSNIWGYESSIRYENEHGEPVENAYGFWGSRRLYDAFGNYDYTVFVDSLGMPVENTRTGYAFAEYTWSDDGLFLKAVDLLDSKKKPVMHKIRGYATIRRTYHPGGQLLKTSYHGLNGELINRLDSGVAYYQYAKEEDRVISYDKEGNRL